MSQNSFPQHFPNSQSPKFSDESQLWEEERAEKGVTTKQSFVDLGCGNGLLVHILSNEGVSIALLSFLKISLGWAKGPSCFLFLF